MPFAVREFSEELWPLISDFGTSGDLFPVPLRLKEEFRDLVQRHIFPGFNLKVDTQRAQKRPVLAAGENSLPFMVWSAGQREFVPLLLGLYYLLTPAGASRRSGVDWGFCRSPPFSPVHFAPTLVRQAGPGTVDFSGFLLDRQLQMDSVGSSQDGRRDGEAGLVFQERFACASRFGEATFVVVVDPARAMFECGAILQHGPFSIGNRFCRQVRRRQHR